jgi:hypothetical protein
MTAGMRCSCYKQLAFLFALRGSKTELTGSCGLATWRTPEGGRDPLSPPQKLTMERLGRVVFVGKGLEGAASHRKLLSQCAGRQSSSERAADTTRLVSADGG